MQAASLTGSLCVLSAIGLLATARLGADDATASSLSGREAKATAQWAKDEFAQMKCTIPGKTQAHLEPHGQSLLTWSNPDVGRVYGEVFLWTDEGRPTALVSLFQWYSPWRSRNAEFRSLTRERLAAESHGQMLWTTQEPGIEWKQLEPAPSPAQTATLRLSQMRAIARRFQSVLKDHRTDPSGVERNLRLLTQPLFRYDGSSKRVLDGGLFGFVNGTDPELLLLVEARSDEAESAWHYALARMNRDAMDVALDGATICRFEYLDRVYFDMQRPYCLAVLGETKPPTP